MSESPGSIEATVCALLRGEALPGPAMADADLHEQIREFSHYHGVAPLVEREIFQSGNGDHRSSPTLTQAVAIELVREHEVRRVLARLAEAGIEVLLLKGAALGYSLYGSPALRPRADTDLLVQIDNLEPIATILADLGYHRPSANRGRLISYQCGFVKQDRLGIEHVLDVHWRINNTQAFSCAMSFEELHACAIPIPALGPHARGLAPVHALLLACLHRVHHLHLDNRAGSEPAWRHERLIWLHDIHLLAESLAPEELEDLLECARAKAMCAVCADGLIEAQSRFGTHISANLLSSLADAGSNEPSARYLGGSAAKRLLNELRALPSWRARIGLLAEHLFPPADYMLEKYGAESRAWLPLLYARRASHGTWKRAKATMAKKRKTAQGDRESAM